MFLLVNKNLPPLALMYLGSLLGFMTSENWFFMWVFLELNTLCFLPIMMKEPQKKITESSMTYFIIQGVSSMLILLSMSYEDSHLGGMISPSLLLEIMIILKLGGGIFFNWMVIVGTTMKPMLLLLLLSVQKIMPFMLIAMSQINLSYMIMLMIIISSIIGSATNMQQNKFKSILIFSSLSHTSWLLIAIIMSNSQWESYFIVYVMTITILIVIFKTNIMQFYSQSKTPSMTLLMMSLGGLPPLPGFFPKLIVIIQSMSFNLFSLMATLIGSAMMDLYVYLRLCFSNSIKTSAKEIFKKSKWEKTSMMWFLVMFMFVFWTL